MAIVRPYEPPPDYPLDDRPSTHHSAYRNPRLYDSASTYSMIRTRQYPEIAGLSAQERTPSLRSFSRFAGEPAHPRNASRQDNRQWLTSSTASFHDTPFCPSRLLPPRNVSSRAGTERTTSQASTWIGDEVSASRTPSSLLLRSAVRPTLRPESAQASTSQHRKALRKSCPDLNVEGEERRRRRMKKREEREWARKDVAKWRLDDVILWLQEIGEEEVASLFIGYEMRGEDVMGWSEESLAALGVEDLATRRKLLSERDKLNKKKTGSQKERRSLFDIITRAAGDQVVVVETPLTVRDLIVARHSSGCLSIQRVAGGNLPLEEGDCLLEIDSVPGEQFTSPLMLTKLISDSTGRPIRFVVLRSARPLCVQPEEEVTRDSSSGVSSSSPVHLSREKLF